MDLKSILVYSAMFGLLVFSILTFTLTAQNDANLTNKITDNDIINETFGDLETSFDSGDSESASENFGKLSPTSEFGEIGYTPLNSIFTPTNVAKKITVGLWNIFIKLPIAILGVNPIVASLISSIFLILIIIAVWAVWKGAIS